MTEVDKLRSHLRDLESREYLTGPCQHLIDRAALLPEHLMLGGRRIRDIITDAAHSGVTQQRQKETERQRFLFETRRKLTDAEEAERLSAVTKAAAPPAPPRESRKQCTFCHKSGAKQTCPKCHRPLHSVCARFHPQYCQGVL